MDAINQAGGFEMLAAHASCAERVIRAESELRLQHLASLADSLRGTPSDDRLGYRIEGQAALIPVIGSLVPRGPVGMARYGVTSYEGIRSELRRAVADDAISTIVLMIDSGGGYVSGVDSAGEAIVAARMKKPVIAVVEGMAASAAYWLASQCDKIIASPCSDIGSIGVIMMHVDVSRALDAAGLKVTVIHAGKKKADFSPFLPLDDSVKAELTQRIEKARVRFAETVVAGRNQSSLDVQAVLDTEAGLFAANEAIGLGLADQIGSLDRLLDALPPAAVMRRIPQTTGRLAATPAPVDAAVLHPCVAPRAPEPSIATAPQDIASELKAAERARIGAILGHPLAQGLGRAFAEHLAYGMDISVEDAITALNAASEDWETMAKDRLPTLAEEMAADPTPPVGPDEGASFDHMTPQQKGAFKAAMLMGKNPMAAANETGRPATERAGPRLEEPPPASMQTWRPPL